MTKDEELIEEEETLDDFWDEAVAEDEDDFVAPTDEDEEEEEVVDTTPIEEEEEVEVEQEEPNADAQLVLAQSEIEQLKHKMSSWEGRIKKANERAKEAEEKLAEKKETGAVDTSPSEEDRTLKEFKEEFPDLVEPMKIFVHKYAEEVASKRLGEVTPVIEEIQERQKISAEENFAAPINDAHPDWETIHTSGKLQKWIDIQPSLQKRVLNEVVQNGNQEEIIEMFNDYKKANNIPIVKQKSTTGGADPNVQSIVAVPVKSAGPPAGKPDMDDFDAGWDDANLRK